jgi:hypothetical protein
MDNDTHKNIEETITNTLLHGFTDSHSIYYLQNSQINIVFAKGYMPLGIFQDRYSEEMSFPTLFYGEKNQETLQKNLHIKKFVNGKYYTNTTTLHITSQIRFTRQLVLFINKFSIVFGLE